MQNITSNIEDDIVHKKALRRMVEMRGGLESLGWEEGALAMLVSM